MDHSAPAPDGPAPLAAPAPTPRRCTADYRWTQPKVIAFLEALSKTGRVAEAARAVGMSRTSAYRLRARMSSARFDAAFEGARRTGIRARAAASRAKLAMVRSPWDAPASPSSWRASAVSRKETCRAPKVALRPRMVTHGLSQGDADVSQSGGPPPQGDAFARKGTEFSPGPCNTRSMSPALNRAGSLPRARVREPAARSATASTCGNRRRGSTADR